MSVKQGHCHCGEVKIQVSLEDDPEVRVVCRDEACIRYGQQLYFVDKKRFALVDGAQELSVYQLEKNGLKLLFCRHCGQQTHMRWLADERIAVNRRLVDEEPSEIIEEPCDLCSTNYDH
ncbi:GFA family protein [Litoribrevibacter albus]|uniref:CENP-V/GFA domain-containing protein n=1 Tax=Litoribrevibacter albus TaxID=1473156 RepID=A0AA37SDN4_9GAMM|nr:hypothetical protein [Litoribrevibacter albus]GLQ33140.1 hypothetical protein GCM10007876_36190 [Litoribrevibacter albus]